MKTRFWILLFGAVGCVCAILAWYFGTRQPDGTVAGVFLDGELVYSVDLSTVTDVTEFTLDTGGGSCTVRVDPEGIRIVSSTCSEQICVHHGLLGSGAPIVCLPNRVVIKWISTKEREFDAITGI